MNHITRSLIVLGSLPLLVLLGACGGSGDDSDEDEDGGSSAEATQAKEGGSSGSSGSGSTGSSKGGEGKTIRDGALTGAVKIDISGDKKAQFEVEGSGVVIGGAVILNFADNDSVVMLTIGTGKDDPGGFAITTQELSTAGEWGKSCDINFDDSESALKGEFACKGIQAVALSATRTYKITVAGSFALKR